MLICAAVLKSYYLKFVDFGRGWEIADFRLHLINLEILKSLNKHLDRKVDQGHFMYRLFTTQMVMGLGFKSL